MRLLPVWVLAVVGWVAAASPGPRPSQDSDEDLGAGAISSPHHDHEDSEDLGPALRELARRKRANTKSSLPYSNYRPSGGIHRYRYPLYRKRSYRPQPQYDYENEAMVPEVSGADYQDYEDYSQGPSLFRERSIKQQQQRHKKQLLLEDDPYLSDDYKASSDYPFHLSNLPYSADLERPNYLYDMGKLEPNALSDQYDLEGLDLVHGGRKSLMPTPSEQFYDAIDTIRKKAMYGVSSSRDMREGSPDYQKLNNLLTSAAGRYWRALDAQETADRDPLIRKKRDTAAQPPVAAETNTTTTPPSTPHTSPTHSQGRPLTSERRKRAFSDYFKWDKRRDDQDSKEVDDLLAREFFKSIARSDGHQTKRMAYAQFEPDKRSSGIEDLLENPTTLQYMQAKLREAEEKVAEEAERELVGGGGSGDNQYLLTNILVRLDSLERMREALSQLRQLRQEEEEEEEHHQRAKRSGAAKDEARRRFQEARKSKRSGEERRRSLRRRLRRRDEDDGEDDLQDVFFGNTRDDCPVLNRILVNCVGVSEEVGDLEHAFLDSCLRHEVCYMCGASMTVSRHECDAVLSSSLEAACPRTPKCLSAAGNTFNLLSNGGRYNDDGTCTQDPCVRQFLESR